MRAVELKEPHASGLVAEDHEVLSHDPDPQRHVEEFAVEGHGLPEAPEVFAAGSPRAHAGELGIGRWHFARQVGAVGRVEEGCGRSHGADIPHSAALTTRVRPVQ